MTFSKLLVAGALAAAFFSPAAQAGVIGDADLAITSLLVISNGAPVTTGLTIKSESRTGSAGANYNGADGTGTGASSKTAFGSGASVDVNYRCGGPDCSNLGTIYGAAGPENNSTTHLATPAGNFALGDMFIAGSAIGGGQGANGLTRANASASTPTNSGGANSTILNSVTVATVLEATQTLTANFALSFNTFVSAFVGALTPGETGLAAGAVGWTLSLSSTDDTAFVPLIWSPTELNQGFTSTDPTQNQSFSSIGTVFSDMRTLLAGHTYLLTINQSSNATALNVIPEPGSLMLVGLGLYALVMIKRRQSGLQ